MATNSNFLLNVAYPKALIVGSKICHQMDDRSFHFGIRKFPLCARCTGIYGALPVSAIVGIFVIPPLYISVILLVPLLIDGFVQLYTKYVSNNLKRSITGVCFGYAVPAIIFSII